MSDIYSGLTGVTQDNSDKPQLRWFDRPGKWIMEVVGLRDGKGENPKRNHGVPYVAAKFKVVSVIEDSHPTRSEPGDIYDWMQYFNPANKIGYDIDMATFQRLLLSITGMKNFHRTDDAGEYVLHSADGCPCMLGVGDGLGEHAALLAKVEQSKLCERSQGKPIDDGASIGHALFADGGAAAKGLTLRVTTLKKTYTDKAGELQTRHKAYFDPA